MKISLLLSTSALLLATSASATTFDNCSYDQMLAFAIENSLITKTYGEKIVHSGGPQSTNPNQSLLVADLVSTSGFREIQLVTCDQNGKMTYSGSSIRQGKVVFTK